MIPPTSNRSVTTGSAQASASFEISVKDGAHIMGILREGLYTDKVLAVLREYSANAWDAHRSVGKHELPIEVTLPTRYEPTLRIRDFGPGLSHDDVFNVYTQYGASTKRDSDDVVGMLGIGSKSGFAYADSFTIISWHGGCRRTYVAVLDESEKGAINLLDTAELPCACGGNHVASLRGPSCSPPETGVEIQIAVKPGDVYEFERTARRLYCHFTPRPTINIELPPMAEERTVLTHGIITPGSGDGWIAVMGCVPYRINLGALDPREVSRCLPNLSGQLTFDIGTVQVNASREELKYSAATKKALVEKFNLLVDEFVLQALKQLESGVLDGWQTRLRVQVLAKLDLPLPNEWRQLAEGFAKVTYTHDDFVILHNNSVCTRLTVSTSTTLLIDDTGNALTGYYFGHDDYVVRCATKTPAELRATLDAVLTASGLTGVKIELLSTRQWTAPLVPVKKKVNPKHRARMFVLKPSPGRYTAPWSEHWTPELRTPIDQDVFVLIEGFKAEGYPQFFVDYAEDAALAESFGVTLPTIYAYKTTDRRPMLESACTGTHYRKWRPTFIQSLLTPERIELIAQHWAANATGIDYNMALPEKKRRDWLAEELGDAHPLVELCVNAAEASKALKAYNGGVLTLATRAGLTYQKSLAYTFVEDLKGRYPLLRRTGFRSLWGSAGYYDDNASAKAERSDWLDYVRMCDERLATKTNNVVQLVSVP